MAVITKPSGINNIWASAGDVLDPGTTKYTTGWQVEIPPRQYFNYIDNKQDQALAHINQFGVAVWDSTTEYQANRSYVQGPTDGIVYRCVSTHTNQNPETDATDTYWTIAFSSAGAFYTKTESDAKYLVKASNLSDLTNTATARTNLNVYSKTETYTKTEVDGKTTIASTAQAQALTSNTVLLTPLRLAEAFQGSNRSTSTNGYQKLPGGTIIQWGQGATTGTGELNTVTFPVTFPTAVRAVIVAERAVAGWGTTTVQPTVYGTASATTSSFQVSSARILSGGSSVFEAGLSYQWIAIGV